MASDVVTIYSDGACLGNPGRGGYGTVLLAGEHRKELQQGYRRTTNNRMELLGAIVGLEALSRVVHRFGSGWRVGSQEAGAYKLLRSGFSEGAPGRHRCRPPAGQC